MHLRHLIFPDTSPSSHFYLNTGVNTGLHEFHSNENIWLKTVYTVYTVNGYIQFQIVKVSAERNLGDFDVFEPR